MPATSVAPPVIENPVIENDVLVVPAEHSTRTPKVLIVEDDVDVHAGWSVFLRHHGYDVLSARDGKEGLALIETERPDIVLLDLGLPGLHGLKILQEVRMRGLAGHIVVASATATAATERCAHAYGASAVLAKPVNLHGLVSTFEELLAD